MRTVQLIGGILLTAVSIPLYYLAPSLLANTVHSFISSMSFGNIGNGAGMLRQMGYPPLREIIPLVQFILMGMAVAGIGIATFGMLAKSIPKPLTAKVIVGEQDATYSNPQVNIASTQSGLQANLGMDPKSFEVVNDVLLKLESELNGIKTGYEDHKKQIEEEKMALEQKEREKMAKIIAAGEVLIKEITPDKFEERANYYVDLKNKDTGQPIDLSLLAERFERMKNTLGFSNRDYLTPSEFDNFKKYLD